MAFFYEYFAWQLGILQASSFQQYLCLSILVTLFIYLSFLPTKEVLDLLWEGEGRLKCRQNGLDDQVVPVPVPNPTVIGASRITVLGL